MKLRGIGIIPRNELVRRARQWRLQLGLAETAGTPEKKSHPERAVVPAQHPAASAGAAEAPRNRPAKPSTRSPGSSCPARARHRHRHGTHAAHRTQPPQPVTSSAP